MAALPIYAQVNHTFMKACTIRNNVLRYLPGTRMALPREFVYDICYVFRCMRMVQHEVAAHPTLLRNRRG